MPKHPSSMQDTLVYSPEPSEGQPQPSCSKAIFPIHCASRAWSEFSQLTYDNVRTMMNKQGHPKTPAKAQVQHPDTPEIPSLETELIPNRGSLEKQRGKLPYGGAFQK